MALVVSPSKSLPRPYVIVLGSRPRAESVGQRLAELGFNVVYEGDTPIALNAQDLRVFFQGFVQSKSPSELQLGVCVHPGVSRWGEKPELPLVCQEFGFNSLTPSPKVLSLFSNRLALLAHADQLGISHLVLSFDPLQSSREVEKSIEQGICKFPFVLKSVWAGSGAGVFVVRSAEDLRRFPLWLEQLRLKCGEAILFPEDYLESIRRIIVPFVRYSDGSLHLFSWVDASLQSRLKRVIDFCPAPSLDTKAQRKMKEWTKKLLDDCGYVGLGTLEFFADGPEVRFLCGGTQLPLGYEVWESVDGGRAIDWQLSALGIQGLELNLESVSADTAYSIGIRLYAEDPFLQLPQPGFVRELSETQSWVFDHARADLRFEIAAGQEVSPEGDGYLARLLVRAKDRNHALVAAKRALDEIWIAGSLQTNERFVRELLTHPFVSEGMFHASFVDEEFLPERVPPDTWTQAIMACFRETIEPTLQVVEGARWAIGDRWAPPTETQVQWVKGPHFWTAPQGTGVSGEISIQGVTHHRICIYPVTPGRWLVRLGPWIQSLRRIFAKDPSKKDELSLIALVSGKVHSLLYRTEDSIPPHEPLVVIESLGALVPHALPVSCRVSQWKVTAEQRVFAGQELAVFKKIV